MQLIPECTLKQFIEENPEVEIALRVVDEPDSSSQKLFITLNNKGRHLELTQTHPDGVYFSPSFESVLVDDIERVLNL